MAFPPEVMAKFDNVVILKLQFQGVALETTR